MADIQYELRYLSLFYEDLEQKETYKSETLYNVKKRRYKYYRIYVKNFVIYYVVIDDVGSKKIMEVRRFLYNKQDYEQLI